VRKLWLLARRTVQHYGEDNCSQLAAGIAFYTLFSIVPLTLFAVSMFGLVVRDKTDQEKISNRIVRALNISSSDYTFTLNDAAINALYGPNASAEIRTSVSQLTKGAKQDLFSDLNQGKSVTVGGRSLPASDITAHSQNPVIDTIRGASRVSGVLTLVGLAGTAWSASALFASIRRSLNMVWRAATKRPFVQQKLVDLGLVVGFGLLLAASIAATATLIALRHASGPFSNGAVWNVIPLFLPAVFSFIVFFAIYRYVPNRRATFATLWPGVILATLLFEVLKNVFSFYVANFTNYDLAFGTLGGVLLFMLWTYLSASILLLGAELCLQYEHAQHGWYHAPSTEPTRPWTYHVGRFVRGLFVHQPASADPAPQPDAHAVDRTD